MSDRSDESEDYADIDSSYLDVDCADDFADIVENGLDIDSCADNEATGIETVRPSTGGLSEGAALALLATRPDFFDTLTSIGVMVMLAAGLIAMAGIAVIALFIVCEVIFG